MQKQLRRAVITSWFAMAATLSALVVIPLARDTTEKRYVVVLTTPVEGCSSSLIARVEKSSVNAAFVHLDVEPNGGCGTKRARLLVPASIVKQASNTG
jgi:hypothetical protein